MAASWCFKSCEDQAYLKAIREVYGKTVTGLGPKKSTSGQFCWIPWLLFIWPLLCFWCIVLISARSILISAFKKCTFKTKNIKTAEKSLISGEGWWLVQLCTTCWAWSMWVWGCFRKRHFIYQKLSGSNIRAFVFSLLCRIIILEYFF